MKIKLISLLLFLYSCNVYNNKIELYYNQGNYKKVLDLTNYINTKDSGNLKSLKYRALAFEKIGKIDEAIKIYKSAELSNIVDFDIYLNLGHLLFEKGETDQSFHYFSSAQKLKPNDYLVNYNLTIYYFAKNEYIIANKYALKILNENIVDPEIYNLVGHSFTNIDSCSIAINYLNKSIQLDSQRPNSHFLRAIAEYYCNLNKEAINDLNLELKLNKNCIECDSLLQLLQNEN